MSQAHVKPVSLEWLVGSAFILVVKPLSPAFTQKKIPVGQEKKPFTKIIFHFGVLEVLRGHGVTAGQNINVVQGDFQESLRHHKDYYVRKISKHYFTRAYTSSIRNPWKDAPEGFLVFLTEIEKSLAFTAPGAYESLSRKEEIMLLTKGAQRCQITPSCL